MLDTYVLGLWWVEKDFSVTVRMNCLVGKFSFAVLNRHHHERSTKLFPRVSKTFDATPKCSVSKISPPRQGLVEFANILNTQKTVLCSSRDVQSTVHLKRKFAGQIVYHYGLTDTIFDPPQLSLVSNDALVPVPLTSDP
jgi:hypothetical protein